MRQLTQEEAHRLEREIARAGAEYMAANVKASLTAKMQGSMLDPKDLPASMDAIRTMRDAMADLSAKAEAFALALDNIARAIDPPREVA